MTPIREWTRRLGSNSTKGGPSVPALPLLRRATRVDGAWPNAMSTSVVAASLMVALTVVPGMAASAEIPAAVEQASRLRAEGRLDEALDTLREESRKVKRADGDDSPLLLPINDLAIDILIEQGSADAAEALVKKVIATRQLLLDDGQSDRAAGLASSLTTLSRLQAATRRFTDALASARQALTVADRATGAHGHESDLARASIEETIDSLESFVGAEDPATLAARIEAAQAYESLGFLDEAIGQRKKVLAAIMNGEADAGGDRLKEGEKLCRDMMLAGRSGDAVPILAGLIANVTPPTSSPAIAARRLLGNLQLADGQLLEAAATYEEILESGRAIKAASATAASADRLRAAMIDAQRRDAQTPPDWLQAELDLLARAPPAERPAAVEALATAAELLAFLELPKPAADQLARAIAMENSLKPPSAERLAELSGRLAAALLAAGDHAAARKTSEPALLAAEKALGPGAAATSFLRVMQAEAVRREGRTEAAVPLLREAVDRGLPRPDDAWEESVIEIVDRFAAADPEEHFRENFVAARARQFGDGHRNVGFAWTLFGAGRLAAGEWDAATESLNTAVSILSQSLGDDHPETAASRALLAHAERLAGNPGRAATTAAAAVAAWERLVGPDHPGTLTAIDVLVVARLASGDTTDVESLLRRLCASDGVFDAVQRAGHLVRLAGLTASHDKALALQYLQRGMALPCWRLEASIRDRDRRTLAFTAARAAVTFKLLGDLPRSEDSLRKARSLALKADNAQELLAEIDQIAAANGRSDTP